MKKYRLTDKFWARTAALILFSVLAAVLVMCIMGTLYSYYEGWYLNGTDVAVESLEAVLFINRYNIITAGIASGAVMLVLFVFLLCSAGHKEDVEECVLIRQDNIPFDLYLAVAAGVLIGALVLCTEILGGNLGKPVELVGAGICIAAAAFVLMSASMTFAARIKTKTVVKNTVIYRLAILMIILLKQLGSWLCKLFDMLSIHLKAGLVFGGYLMINAILAAAMFNSRYSGFALVILGFFNCLALYAVLECAGWMKTLNEAAEAIAEGDLNREVDASSMKWVFRDCAENLNCVGRGLAKAVNERMRSERFKTELITNVSHDLKTPLTSIVTYIDLLKKENIEGERAKEYVDTVARQSEKLKKLTEDLVEASKASSGAMSVAFERVNASEFLRQSAAEYGERMAMAGITPIVSQPEEDVFITADGRLLWRTVDNLLLNICRHGMAGTRAYLSLSCEGNKAVLCFKNISAKELNIPADELMERFVQGDSSRNSEGSGLGLSIARSLTELMKGEMTLHLDGDLFKVELTFPAAE